MRTPHLCVIFRVMALRGPGEDLTARTLPTVREEWVRWLNGQDWKTFVTATFASRSTDQLMAPSFSRVSRAARRIERQLIMRVDVPSFFGVLETGMLNGRMHLHFLLSLDARRAESAFSEHRAFQGFTKVIPLSQHFGVTEYVTKYVTKGRDPLWIAGGKWQAVATS